ncbi:MAG: hypothetical protein R3277_03865 [Brumimicrobium sp.]|nr:hypothetical protein [Brumimicrobium sp.]
MKNELTGFWKGKFTYQKGYKSFNGEAVEFEMNLEQKGMKFSGKCKDLEGFGSHPDKAQISGEIKDSKISFTKQYPSLHYPDKKGNTIIDKSEKGPSIAYEGVYNDKSQKYEGTWVLSMRYYIFGLIPKTYTGKGTWELTKKESATNIT